MRLRNGFRRAAAVPPDFVLRPETRLRAYWFGSSTLMLAVILCAGCRGTKSTYQPDPTIARQAKDAQEAYVEGADREAIAHYTLALKRAWAIDNPLEIGHNAYNLSACLAAVGFDNEARDCLREARAELERAGQPDTATWLLEAKIARSQGFTDEAVMLVDLAQQTIPVDEHDRARKCRSGECGHQGCVALASHVEGDSSCKSKKKHAWWPFGGKKKKHQHNECCEEEEEEDCITPELAQADVHLLRAELAADQYDLPLARGELAQAIAAAGDDAGSARRAQIERISGRILLLEGEPASAARRLDNEAYWLRRAKLYREIPSATGAAGEAYEAAGELSLAAERYYRVARMLYARDEWRASLAMIDRAVWLAVAVEDLDVQCRLAFLFHLVDLAVQEAAKKQQKQQSATSKPATAPATPPAVPPTPPAPTSPPPAAPPPSGAAQPDTSPPPSGPMSRQQQRPQAPSAIRTTIPTDEKVSALRDWSQRRVKSADARPQSSEPTR